MAEVLFVLVYLAIGLVISAVSCAYEKYYNHWSYCFDESYAAMIVAVWPVYGAVLFLAWIHYLIRVAVYDFLRRNDK